MTPRTCSQHTQKQQFMERWHFKVKDRHCTEARGDCCIVPWQSWFDHIGTKTNKQTNKKSLLPNQEEQLMIEAWHQLRNEEEGGLLAFLLSFYYKPTEVSGRGTHSFTHLQTSQMSYSNSSPFIYHFDSHWKKISFKT